MLDIKKLLTNMLNKTIRSVTVPNLSTDSNGYMQLPSSLDNAILVWAETDSHAGITEHPYFLNNPPSYPTKHSMRFKQWDEQALYKNTTKTVTVWYIPWGGYSVIVFMSTIAHLAERWWRYVRREEITDKNAYYTQRHNRSERGLHSIPPRRFANSKVKLSIRLVCHVKRIRQTIRNGFVPRQGLQRFHICGLCSVYKHFRRGQGARLMGWHSIGCTVWLFAPKGFGVLCLNNRLTSERGWSCA